MLLVLTAAGFVLAAPVIGRLGAPALADAAMVVAASCGVAAFVLAGLSTLRAARRDATRGPSEEGR